MKIADYELIQRCGQGSYGEVWIARNLTGIHVALKIVSRTEQIEKEFAGLRHYAKIKDSANLIQIYHIGEVDNTLYYTMQLADNFGTEECYQVGSLASWLVQKKRLSIEETLWLTEKLLDGLDVLHKARLVHRDIKPQNILFVDGEPKLSDIGLVRSISQTLSLGGTLGFIPPERLKDGSSGKTSTDDLYALGKVMYCCLTGNDVDAYPSFPTALVKEGKYHHLNNIILMACNKNPLLRFKNIADFRNALKYGIGKRKRLLSSWLKWRYWLLAGCLLIVVSSLLVTTMSLWRKTKPYTEPPIKLGEILRSSFGQIVTDSGGGDTTTQSFPNHAVYNSFAPKSLEYTYRKEKVLSSPNFRVGNWRNIKSRGFSLSNELQLVDRADGIYRLMAPLPYLYSISFDIDYSRLSELLRFQVAVLDRKGRERAYYQWSLERTNGKLKLNPLEYLADDGSRKRHFRLVGQPSDSQGVHKVEMVMTTHFFRLIIDGELLIHAPSLFHEGNFAIIAECGGGNSVTLKNLQIYSLHKDRDCPPEQQYNLPFPSDGEAFRPPIMPGTCLQCRGAGIVSDANGLAARCFKCKGRGKIQIR